MSGLASVMSRRAPLTTPRIGSRAHDRCVCGTAHHVPIDAIVIDECAIEQLCGYAMARRWSRPMVIMDANTEEAIGWRVVSELSRVKIRVAAFRFPDRSGLLADESSISRLQASLNQLEIDSFIAVGSGVITDITRYVASRMNREFVSVPTAASMDGYASNVAAMEFGGIRTSYLAVPPVAIFADTKTIAAAPHCMTRAGLGDLLGKASARIDWLMSHGLYREQFCPEAERRVVEPLVHAATHVDDIVGQSPEAVSQLLRGLVESGIAMAMVGSSRPASGCEHHASHFWDLLASRGWRPRAPHGLQVGYATHFAMRLQRFAFGGGVSVLTPPRPVVADGEDARLWFAGHAVEVDAVIEEKRRYLREHGSAWPATLSQWEALQGQAAEAMRVFPVVSRALLAAGIPSDPGFFDLDTATLKTTFRLANRLRSRYTVLDFLEGQGRLEEAIDDALSSPPAAP